MELADIFRQHGPTYREAWKDRLPSNHYRVMRSIELCRTAELGGHAQACDNCEHRQIAYNSCRNRHCPKCQGLARARWLEARQAELLPVEYFHVVFTVPEIIAQLALSNKKALYSLLFQATSETLLTIGADPKHLGAELGFLAVLHTWGQNLMHHPHLHCIIPGGGLLADGAGWKPCRKGFFLPVRVLSRMFRGKFLHGVQQLYHQGKLVFPGALARHADAQGFGALLRQARETDWVVYAKRPFGGPDQVLAYLGRYTHRVAISNQRLLSLSNGQVTFSWKDYRTGQARKTMTLPAHEFIRRFMVHLLPKSLVRIRYFGFLGNRVRRTKLEECRRLLNVQQSPELGQAPSSEEVLTRLLGRHPDRCPECERGMLIRLDPQRPGRPGPNTS